MFLKYFLVSLFFYFINLVQCRHCLICFHLNVIDSHFSIESMVRQAMTYTVKRELILSHLFFVILSSSIWWILILIDIIIIPEIHKIVWFIFQVSLSSKRLFIFARHKNDKTSSKAINLYIIFFISYSL